jgi:hypothetical protein
MTCEVNYLVLGIISAKIVALSFLSMFKASFFRNGSGEQSLLF